MTRPPRHHPLQWLVKSLIVVLTALSNALARRHPKPLLDIQNPPMSSAMIQHAIDGLCLTRRRLRIQRTLALGGILAPSLTLNGWIRLDLIQDTPFWEPMAQVSLGLAISLSGLLLWLSAPIFRRLDLLVAGLSLNASEAPLAAQWATAPHVDVQDPVIAAYVAAVADQQRELCALEAYSIVYWAMIHSPDALLKV